MRCAGTGYKARHQAIAEILWKSRWPESGRVRVKTLAENICPFLLFQLFTLARYAIALFMIIYECNHRSRISWPRNPENEEFNE